MGQKYKLTYFNIRWLGEGARLLFRYAGVPFEDVRITPEQWAQLKQKTPFGQLPLLEVDGHVIPQSAAIYRYLGRQFNLVPKCPIEEALVDAAYDAHKDFQTEIEPYSGVASGFRQGNKEELLKDVFIPARDKYFGFLKKELEKAGSGYLVGKSVSWADIVIADNLYVIYGMAPSLFEGYAEVQNFADRIRNLPNLKEYISERLPSHI